MSKVVVWLRQDLRLHDNPALNWAVDNFETVLPVFIYEHGKIGAASKWWLHHSLDALDKSLEELGSKLFIFSGDPEKVIPSLPADAFCWNRTYQPDDTKRDTKLKDQLKNDGKEVKSFLGDLLAEPLTFENNSGSPYKVFTPFWKKLKAEYTSPKALPSPKKISSQKTLTGESSLKKLDLLPKVKWDAQFYDEWTPGESGAQKRLKDFLKKPVKTYTEGRNIPSINGTSKLSPHLHFGEISPHEIWRQTQKAVSSFSASETKSADVFLSEVAWRDFGKHLLFHFPSTIHSPLNEKFEKFPWKSSKKDLEAWQKGKTGLPIVDAGMRELWATGWMHNRVRMIVGSFLVKNLLISWESGMDWFWDTLVDADLGSNTLGWQWIGGCGADAAPYFRVFNPVLQGEKFDSEGKYVKKWVPELEDVDPKEIHKPQSHALVDLKESRQRALEAYNKIK